MSQKTDEQLVAAFQRGDTDAFEVFVIRHQDRIFRLARLWLVDTDAAADVLQETLLRSYTGFSRFRFRAAPLTWLLRICRNVCREFNRRRRLDTLDPESAELMIDPDPGADIDSSERLKRLHQAIHQLPERQRQVVALRILEEQSVAETAAVMGCRPGTVKAHLHKALANLRNRHDLDLTNEQ